MKFFKLLHKYGVLKPLGEIALTVAALYGFLYVMMWVGNLYADDAQLPAEAAASWGPPTMAGPSNTYVPPPQGFPSMEFPPPLIEAPEGRPQPVPTKYGLTYTVPGADGWRATNSAIMGWTDDDGYIAGYGAASDYGYKYCPERDGSALAEVGITGRNGVDIDTAARDAVGKAERIFSDDAGHKPTVEIRGPRAFEVSGRPAIGYNAVVTNIPQEHECDPTRAEFDIVATAGYFSAEVAVFMVEHHMGLDDALSESTVDEIIESLGRTDE